MKEIGPRGIWACALACTPIYVCVCVHVCVRTYVCVCAFVRVLTHKQRGATRGIVLLLMYTDVCWTFYIARHATSSLQAPLSFSFWVGISWIRTQFNWIMNTNVFIPVRSTFLHVGPYPIVRGELMRRQRGVVLAMRVFNSMQLEWASLRTLQRNLGFLCAMPFEDIVASLACHTK